MSLLDSLNIAASGLRTTQASIAVVSQNVSNAQTPGYSERSAVVAQLPAQSGVQVTGISRATNAALQQQSLAQSSQSAGDAALSSLYQQLENVTGSGSATSPALSTALSTFQTDWQSYEASPDSSVAEQQVVADGQAFTRALGNVADGVQALAQSASSTVASNVTALNSDLTQINQLNQQIVTAQATGTSVPDLQDQRDGLVAQVANLVPVQTVARADGSLSVLTTNGLSLVDKTATTFSWDGTNITAGGSATSLNSSFAKGGIGATLGFIATDSASVSSSDPNVGTLQKLTDQLDAFAASFYDTTATPSPAFEAAYDGATTQTGEQASSFFTTSDGSATATAFNLAVNPNLVDGTAQLKQAAATPIVAALTASAQSLNVGGLSLSGQSYAGIANGIISNSSINASNASNAAASSAATASALSSQLSSAVGVNLDDEMSKLIVLQNSYAAAARVVSTISTMMNTLLTIGQG